MAEKKYVYSFEEGHALKLGKDILGGKGFGLNEMTAAGINIPPGFTVSTEACTLYYESGKKIPDYVWDDIVAHVHDVEKKVGKFHFDPETHRAMDEKGDLVFMERDDKKFMRTTIVSFNQETEQPEVSYREFEHSLIKPRLRNYAVAKKE